MPPFYHRVESDGQTTPIKYGIVTASGLDIGEGAYWNQPIFLRLHEASVMGSYTEVVPTLLRLHDARVIGVPSS